MKNIFTKVVLAALTGAVAQGCAAAQEPGEYQVKGAFLLNFAKFVEWPSDVFKTPEDPIAICVLGQKPFGPGLDRAAKETMAANRAVIVRNVSGGHEASQCQIVFVSASERKLSRELLDAVRSESVLTVGESEGFVTRGGVIGFRVEGDKVRIEINKTAAERAKLRISAKLLSLAASGKR